MVQGLDLFDGAPHGVLVRDVETDRSRLVSDGIARREEAIRVAGKRAYYMRADGPDGGVRMTRRTTRKEADTLVQRIGLARTPAGAPALAVSLAQQLVDGVWAATIRRGTGRELPVQTALFASRAGDE